MYDSKEITIRALARVREEKLNIKNQRKLQRTFTLIGICLLIISVISIAIILVWSPFSSQLPGYIIHESNLPLTAFPDP